MLNILLAFATIAGCFIAFFPDNNSNTRFIILLVTAIIVIFAKMYEFIRENRKLKQEIIEKDEKMSGVEAENEKLKKEIIEKEKTQNIIDEKHRKFDSNILKEIKNILNDYHTIEFIRDHDFEGAYAQDRTDPLFSYFNKNKNEPEFRFLDSDLNNLKKDLDTNIAKLLDVLVHNTFDLEVNKDFRGIPKDWREKAPEHHGEIVDKANHHADKIVEVYSELVQLANKKTLEF